jgi:DNA-binding NtrC family response regulator
VSRPKTSWETKVGEARSPLAGISEKDPPIVITDEGREKAARRLEEQTRPYVKPGRAKLLTLEERNILYARRVIKLCGGSVGRSAKILGIGRSTLYRMMARQKMKTAKKRG